MENKPPLWSNICKTDEYSTVQYGDNEEEKAKGMQSRRKRKPKNCLENKVSISIEGEEYKQEPKSKLSQLKQDATKESYDNILILESTESLTNKELKNTSYPLLDKSDNIHVNWSEVDDEDTIRRNELSKL
jgi:hypothetical protein